MKKWSDTVLWQYHEALCLKPEHGGSNDPDWKEKLGKVTEELRRRGQIPNKGKMK